MQEKQILRCENCGRTIDDQGTLLLAEGQLCARCAQKISCFSGSWTSRTIEDVILHLQGRAEDRRLFEEVFKEDHRSQDRHAIVRADFQHQLFYFAFGEDFKRGNPLIFSFSRLKKATIQPIFQPAEDFNQLNPLRLENLQDYHLHLVTYLQTLPHEEPATYRLFASDSIIFHPETMSLAQLLLAFELQVFPDHHFVKMIPYRSDIEAISLALQSEKRDRSRKPEEAAFLGEAPLHPHPLTKNFIYDEAAIHLAFQDQVAIATFLEEIAQAARNSYVTLTVQRPPTEAPLSYVSPFAPAAEESDESDQKGDDFIFSFITDAVSNRSELFNNPSEIASVRASADKNLVGCSSDESRNSLIKVDPSRYFGKLPNSLDIDTHSDPLDAFMRSAPDDGWTDEEAWSQETDISAGPKGSKTSGDASIYDDASPHDAPPLHDDASPHDAAPIHDDVTNPPAPFPSGDAALLNTFSSRSEEVSLESTERQKLSDHIQSIDVGMMGMTEETDDFNPSQGPSSLFTQAGFFDLKSPEEFAEFQSIAPSAPTAMQEDGQGHSTFNSELDFEPGYQTVSQSKHPPFHPENTPYQAENFSDSVPASSDNKLYPGEPLPQDIFEATNEETYLQKASSQVSEERGITSELKLEHFTKVLPVSFHPEPLDPFAPYPVENPETTSFASNRGHAGSVGKDNATRLLTGEIGQAQEYLPFAMKASRDASSLAQPKVPDFRLNEESLTDLMGKVSAGPDVHPPVSPGLHHEDHDDEDGDLSS